MNTISVKMLLNHTAKADGRVCSHNNGKKQERHAQTVIKPPDNATVHQTETSFRTLTKPIPKEPEQSFFQNNTNQNNYNGRDKNRQRHNRQNLTNNWPNHNSISSREPCKHYKRENHASNERKECFK